MDDNDFRWCPFREEAMIKNTIKDRGGTRSGNDRRWKNSIYIKLDRRSGKERRSGCDRRGDIMHFDGIERRDIFRK